MRTDIHRPSAIVPTDYEYVGQECMKIEGIGDCYAVLENRKRIAAHMASSGGSYSRHEHGGNCHICGSINAVYTHLFWHRPSNTYVRTGEECTNKLDYAGNADDMGIFRTALKDARELSAGKRKAEAILSDAGLSVCWTIFSSDSPRYEENVIRSIVGNLVRYGNISDKQVAFLRSLAGKIDSRMAVDSTVPDCPNGRIIVSGEILSVKTEESIYGPTLKMLFRADAGWKAYGTVPASLRDNTSLEGRITLTATFERSNRDPKFGFFKRPK